MTTPSDDARSMRFTPFASPPAQPGTDGGVGRADLGAVVFGVVNVTPDSFSDGGRFHAHEAAVAQGRRLWGEGAYAVDVGGESTRPGADRVEPDEEVRRVVPVVRDLVSAGIRVSVDTMRARVAEAALDAGAEIVNDVSGGLADPDMARVVADTRCPWVLMHWRGHSRDMASQAEYVDVVRDVRAELRQRVDAAVSAGVCEERIILDPGLGFAKTAEHNWQVLSRLGEIVSLGFPVLVGASRKSFLGALLGDPVGGPRPPDQRLAATIATTVVAMEAGAWGVRVHEVLANVDAIRVLRATQSRSSGTSPSSGTVASPGTGPGQ